VQETRSDPVPITTASAEARALYLKGRDFAEKLRGTDARQFYLQAVAKDPDFALAWVGLANTAGTTKDFIDAVTRAAALAGRVSEGERHLVLGLESAMKGNPSGVLSHYTELVRLHPNDERAHTLLGNTYFGRQEYQAAIRHFEKATAINASFSQPYNQLGYAHRFMENFDAAEAAFKKYVELIPNDPNPHDSYAELLLKTGRFDESIRAYERALSLAPDFVASYIGIGNAHLYAGRIEAARTTFGKIASIARTTGERRTARFWTAAAFVFEGQPDKAIAELKAGYALAQAENDLATMSGDLTLIADVLREAGRLDDARATYNEAVAVMEKAQVPPEVKEATRRTHVFEEARLAVASGDLRTARAKAEEYGRLIAPRKAPFEIRLQHELAGRIALAEKRGADAVKEFALANQQDPVILYLTALAWKDAGNAAKAAAMASRAANFNGLAFGAGYVRKKAAAMTAS
jgi:tetratricopeptide (TPR) repeat protein